MSGLLDSLSSASRSLTAARLGIDVAGQNLANINTEGYSRRTLLLAENAPVDSLSAGNGVSVLGILAQRDRFINARLRSEIQAGAEDTAVLGGLTEIESAIGLPGQSVDAQLAAFFDAFKTLADDPTSVTARDGVVVQARQLATAFHGMNDRFEAARRNADVAISSSAEEINRMAAEVARLNEAIVAGGADVESLRDQRDVVVSQLSELAGVGVTLNADGGVNLTMGSGRALVVGVTAYSLTAQPNGPSGFTTLHLGGYDVTSEITGGTLAGLVQVRDDIVPGYQTRLDQLAYDVATQVNTLHQAGFDATGTAGGDFFVAPTGVAGAAAALAVDAAVVADSSLVAASGTGAVGDNQSARAIAGLRDARVASGGTATPTEAWAQLAYRVGTDVQAARASAATREDVVRQIERLRAQTSGVSMDEEAANLMRFQRSYEANARYFTAIVDTLDTLMGMVR